MKTILGLRSLATQLSYRFKATTATDPIQQVFLSKIKEYRELSKKAELGLVGASADDMKALNDQLAKLERIYEAAGQDMTKFPTIKFTNPKITPISSSVVSDLPKPESVELEQEVKTEYVKNKLVI